jgi:hypothetical protein
MPGSVAESVCRAKAFVQKTPPERAGGVRLEIAGGALRAFSEMS